MTRTITSSFAVPKGGASAVLLVLALLAPLGTAKAATPQEEWQAAYREATNALLAERYEEAVLELQRLVQTAPTAADGRLASELLKVARTLAARSAEEAPELRTRDELSVLYSTAFVYGLGTSAWLTLQIKPQTVAGALLPFAAITTAAVGSVAVADNYRPLRRGLAHSIAAGLYIGFGQGVWVVGYEHSRQRRLGEERWGPETVSTLLWAGATAGGFAGALIGGARGSTPGRASYVASTTLWGGLITGFTGALFEPDDRRRGEVAYLAAGIGYNLGLITGVLTAPYTSPSVARVRFVDLGGIGGALASAGGYALIAGDDADPRAGLGIAALGAAVGLGVTWWLTDDMPEERRKPEKETPRTGSVRALVTPVEGGILAGLAGDL